MNKKFLLLSFLAIAALLVFNTPQVNSEVPSPPAGNTGDAFTSLTCARSGCHNSPVSTPPNGDLTFNIGTGTPSTPLDATFQYVPGTTYNLAFVLLNATGGRYGFQVSALNAGATQAGTFAVSDATNTMIKTLQARSYMGHRNASSFKNWVFKWTAPASGSGPVTFNYSYNNSNNDGAPQGDQIFVGSVTINESTVGVNDIADFVADLSVFPNPATSDVAFAFDLLETNTVSARLFSIDGRLQNSLMNETVHTGKVNRSFDVSSLSAGVYFLQLQVGNATVTRKIFKQ